MPWGFLWGSFLFYNARYIVPSGRDAFVAVEALEAPAGERRHAARELEVRDARSHARDLDAGGRGEIVERDRCMAHRTQQGIAFGLSTWGRGRRFPTEFGQHVVRPLHELRTVLD